jgi:hypothetical protein
MTANMYLKHFVCREVKDMHVYMEPLIDEILQLYETGVPAYDVSAPMGRGDFILKAALL